MHRTIHVSCLLFLLLTTGLNAQLFQDDFGTVFGSLDAVKWPSGCRSGASGFNTSIGDCAGTNDRNYSLSGFGSYITTAAIAIPSSGYTLSFDYQFDYFSFSAPEVEIRTGGACGTTLQSATTLAVAATCTPASISLNAYAGQTIYIRFVSNTSSEPFYIDNILVDGSGGGGGPGGDFKWADNFNDNNLILNYAGNDGDEACTGCGNWNLGNGASLELVPSSGWNGNSNRTEAFPDNMSNVYYARLDRDEYIESPTMDLSGQEGFKISFYAKSSSSGSGGGDSWSSFSDHLRLQIWDGSSWITVKDITEGAFNAENQISPALPFNYFCFTAYKSNNSPGNYYYNSTPNVDASYFHSNFKFRVIFEGGFSGAPFAWVDDFTFRADADGYSTMVPCGLSFWNEPAATGYGQDPGATALNHSERGVNLELNGSVSFPPNWATEANDGDQVDQVFGLNESERVVFCVISEQEIQFSFPWVSFSTPSLGNQSTVMSQDNNYTGPGFKYYAVEYVSCDLASGSISEPTDQFEYHYVFEYGNEFIPVFYHLNSSGIESGGGATSSFERFDAPDVTSTDECGTLPVEWLSFEANYDANTEVVLLEWATANEENNAGFVIERSAEGLVFEEIGWVAAKGGTGASYVYADEQLTALQGPVYYRLRQLDEDGTESYSAVVAAQLPTRQEGWQVYPNPIQDQLHLNLSEELKDQLVQVVVYNAMGQRVASFNDLNANLLTISTNDWPVGTYVLQLQLKGGKVLMERVIRN